ncbi:hypothetical protein Salat_0224200 [Sesamum alatum]|uniref:Uncharacterized protein n=1 Tax=Sesamum alatum TaxID=300844 RepID=A0AAE1YZ29_9LAMI|nr:hypothetical protein Salat_0224200 [Sesamum alatum]
MLGRLRLTDDEEQRLVLPGGLWHTDSDTHRLCLVGRLLSTLVPRFEAFSTSMQGMINPVKGMDLRQIGGVAQCRDPVLEAKLARESRPASQRGAAIFRGFSKSGRSDSAGSNNRGEASPRRVGVAAASVESFSPEQPLRQARGVGTDSIMQISETEESFGSDNSLMDCAGVETRVSAVRITGNGPAGAKGMGLEDSAEFVLSTIPEVGTVWKPGRTGNNTDRLEGTGICGWPRGYGASA